MHRNLVSSTQIQTLIGDGNVDPSILSVWATILNQKEKECGGNKKVFIGLDVASILQDKRSKFPSKPKKNKGKVAIEEKDNVDSDVLVAGMLELHYWIDSQGLNKLSSYEMIVIPVYQDNHYFVLVFDLPSALVHVADNMPYVPGKLDILLQDMRAVLEQTFTKDGKEQNAVTVRNSKRRFIQLDCKDPMAKGKRTVDSTASADSSIFAIRYMQRLLKTIELHSNIQPRQMMKLERIKVAAEILLSSYNESEDELVRLAAEKICGESC